ncbi:MAG: saccharopine dehydrogenase C-terminal domain-containing protein [Gemmatimonadales bacterium]
MLYTYGAGFPAHSLSTANPLGYKFTWSVVDTIRSYAIPGSVIRNGRAIDIPADGMFTPGNFHHLDVPDLGGPLECFVNGDANELTTLFPGRLTGATSLGRFICRWPGHAAFWEKMVKCGFNRLEPVNVNGTLVDPAAFCAALLGSQEQFAYGPGEQDVALIRADARGTKHGRPTRVIQQLIDRRDLETGYTAMQRTVAFPMSIGAQMILDGRLTQRGVVEPSAVPAEPLFAGLAERGLTVTRHTEAWDGATAPEPTISG